MEFGRDGIFLFDSLIFRGRPSGFLVKHFRRMMIEIPMITAMTTKMAITATNAVLVSTKFTVTRH